MLFISIFTTTCVFWWETIMRLRKIERIVYVLVVIKKTLNFIYFTTITKQVIQLVLIMLVGTDVCVRMVFVWEETGVPGGNPPV